MKNKKTIIASVILLLVALCGLLYFGVYKKTSNADSNSQSGLQLGIPDEEKEDSKDKEDSSATESKPESTSEQNSDQNTSNSDSTEENSDVPEGGQVIDNGDGSVDVVLNDDEATYGL